MQTNLENQNKLAYIKQLISERDSHRRWLMTVFKKGSKGLDNFFPEQGINAKINFVQCSF